MDDSSPISMRLVGGPLGCRSELNVVVAGAKLCFEGVVRPLENDRPLASLEYEAYEPMTSREMTRLCVDVLKKYELLALDVEHSVGNVEVGRISFRLQIASRHRGAGLAAMTEFIDRMKQHVPLWKNPVWSSEVSHHE